jgi:hypothetical protein
MGFLVLKPSELVCDELRVIFPQCKGFHLGEVHAILVEIGKWMVVFGSRTQVSISSPVKSTRRRMIELKKSHHILQ